VIRLQFWICNSDIGAVRAGLPRSRRAMPERVVHTIHVELADAGLGPRAREVQNRAIAAIDRWPERVPGDDVTGALTAPASGSAGAHASLAVLISRPRCPVRRRLRTPRNLSP
jgi:hypothetical protein